MEDRKKKVKSILVTLPKPENDKNPYAELAKKLNLKIDFRSFIHVEGVPAKDFRKEKINLADFSAVIFTSRNSADEDERAGRWRGRPKTECGIHTMQTA